MIYHKSYITANHISYNATIEIEKRARLEKPCEGQQHGIMSVNHRTNFVSRFRISDGDIPFSSTS